MPRMSDSPFRSRPAGARHLGAAAALLVAASAILFAAGNDPLLQAPESRSPESGKTFKGPGGTLYYEVKGSAPGVPLVVVNGGPGFDHSYLHVSEAWDLLAKKRPVVFYDQRG